MATKRFFFEKEETKITKIKGYIDLEMDFTQLYKNVYKYIIHLEDKWACKYLFWLITRTNDYGYIDHSKSSIQLFLDDIKTEDVKFVPSIKSVQDAMTELVKKGIVIKHSNSNYQLNSKIFWSGTLDSRLENVKHLILEEKIK